MDADHDLLEALVDFLTGPRQAERVLGHLEAGGRNATGVAGLAGCEEHASVLEGGHGFGGAGHVGALGHGDDAVRDQHRGFLTVELVLRGARQRHVHVDAPQTVERGLGLGGRVGHAVVAGHLGDAPSAVVLQVHDLGEHGTVDAARHVNPAAGVGHGHGLAAEVEDLLCGELCDVSGTGDGHGGAFEGLALGGEHLTGEVHAAVAGGFGSDERATVVEALAGQDAGLEVVAELAVHAEHVADFTTANADVARRHVEVVADVAPEFHHEGLAEAHDLGVGLALGIEVRTALAAAHRKAGQAVLENLLKGEELEDGRVHRGVEAQTALVGTNRAVELNAEATVDLQVAVVVHPGDAELNHALWLCDALDDVAVVRVLLQHRLEAFQNFPDRLMEFRLVGVALLDGFKDVVDDAHGVTFRLRQATLRPFLTVAPACTNNTATA